MKFGLERSEQDYPENSNLIGKGDVEFIFGGFPLSRNSFVLERVTNPFYKYLTCGFNWQKENQLLFF